MLNPNRRIVQAKEESAKAMRRGAAAKQQIADTLREMLLAGDNTQSVPPPLSKKQSPKK